MSDQEMNDFETRLSTLREKVAAFVAERDWEQFHSPENLALSISLEAAELLEVFQWKLRRQPEEGYSKKEQVAMKEELADIFIYLLSFFNSMDWDVTPAVLEKLERNRKKYPVSVYKGKFEKKAD